jgi:uncharacterized protein (TIGR03083 family)
MTERADQVISAMRVGHDRLATLVRGFAADDLTHPSGASEWNVAQVLSHLGSGAEIGLATLQGALEGTGSPAGDFNPSVWARWDAMSPAEQAEGFLKSDEALVAAYENLSPEQRSDLRIDLGFLPEPLDVAAAGTMRLSEFTHHTWDVEVAYDPAATLAPEATPLLLGTAGMFVGFAARPAALEGRHAHLAVRLTSPEQSLGLDLGEAVTVTEEPADADAVLTAPAEWWLRLIAGRHAAEHTPATVSVTGGSLTVDDLRRVFPGF